MSTATAEINGTVSTLVDEIAEKTGVERKHQQRQHYAFEAAQSVIANGVTIGKLAGFGLSGTPLVDFKKNTSANPIPALSIISLSENDRGRNVALMFEEGDLGKPIVMGLVQNALIDDEMPPAAQPESKPINVEIDGERVVFTAEKEIVLNCGKASITLTHAGKVLIRGEYVLSRSTGVNRLKGGSIQLN